MRTLAQSLSFHLLSSTFAPARCALWFGRVRRPSRLAANWSGLQTLSNQSRAPSEATSALTWAATSFTGLTLLSLQTTRSAFGFRRELSDTCTTASHGSTNKLTATWGGNDAAQAMWTWQARRRLPLRNTKPPTYSHVSHDHCHYCYIAMQLLGAAGIPCTAKKPSQHGHSLQNSLAVRPDLRGTSIRGHTRALYSSKCLVRFLFLDPRPSASWHSFSGAVTDLLPSPDRLFGRGLNDSSG
mmetsp:Transcript_2708/g.9840  ORF Transcript_2708/g.9840 Transcript_2708/m.9840 type:complete len:241 (+) Transcript_2708:198-920(+)